MNARSRVDEEKAIGLAVDVRPSRVSFLTRHSPLTELQKHDELKAAYGLLISLYLFFATATLANYFLDPQWALVDANFLTEQLSTSHFAIATWFVLHIIGYVIIYPIVCLLYKDTSYRIICRIVLTAAMVICTMLPPWAILQHRLGFLLTFILVVEKVRLLMKYVSFIIENSKEHREDCFREYLSSCASVAAGYVLSAEEKNKDTSNIKNNNNTNKNKFLEKERQNSFLPEVTCEPSLSKFTYFLFAPTLIYRPWYPRLAGRVNWSLVAMYFSEFFAFWFLGLQLLTKFLMPTFHSAGLEPFKVSQLTMDFFKVGLCASVCFFGLGYGFLHCWLNAFAEMLRFADRQFYREWWLSGSVGQFWRRWNLLVHLWLSEYVYSPLMTISGGNIALSMGAVYLLSGLVHEYATGLALRLVLPVFASVMFFSFPLTYLIYFSPKQNKVLVITLLHSILWLSISAVLMAYSLEIFSRKPPK